jgi:hypothetical protein
VADFSSLIEVTVGPKAGIRMSSRAHKEYLKCQAGTDERSVKRRVVLERYFQEFCRSGGENLNNQQFKKQGNFSDKRGRKIAIWEFKAYQWRLYGAITEIDGLKTFVGVRVDPDKKQDRADRGILEAAAQDLGELLG